MGAITNDFRHVLQSESGHQIRARVFGLSSVRTSRANLLFEIQMSEKPECLLAGLSRFQVAYQTGLERDIEPLSREAITEGLQLIPQRAASQPSGDNAACVMRGLVLWLEASLKCEQHFWELDQRAAAQEMIDMARGLSADVTNTNGSGEKTELRGGETKDTEAAKAEKWMHRTDPTSKGFTRIYAGKHRHIGNAQDEFHAAWICDAHNASLSAKGDRSPAVSGENNKPAAALLQADTETEHEKD
jgi:hypothetical protein